MRYRRGMKTLLVTAPMPEGYFSHAIRALDPDIDLIEHDPALSDAQLAEVDAVLAWQLPKGLVPRLPRLLLGVAPTHLALPDQRPESPRRQRQNQSDHQPCAHAATSNRVETVGYVARRVPLRA